MTKHGQTLLVAEGGRRPRRAAARSSAAARAARRAAGKLSEDVEVSDIELDEATFTATAVSPGRSSPSSF